MCRLVLSVPVHSEMTQSFFAIPLVWRSLKQIRNERVCPRPARSNDGQQDPFRPRPEAEQWMC